MKAGTSASGATIRHTLNNWCFSIKYGQSFSGLFGLYEYDECLQGFAMSLDEALNQTFQSYDACLVNIRQTICAAVRQGSWYAVIDSHARLSDGTVSNCGKSVVVYHCSIDSLVIHFRRLGASLNAYNHPFEVTGVQANIDKHIQHDRLVRQDNTDAERVSKGADSEVASCSYSLTDFISTDQMLVNEPCSHESTGKYFDCPSNENASEVELVLQNDCVSLTDIISRDQAVDETCTQKKTMYLCPRSESTADVEFISQTDSVYHFSPLTLQQQKKNLLEAEHCTCCKRSKQSR